MKHLIACGLLAGSLAACTMTKVNGVSEPSANTMATLQAGVTLAESAAFAYENLPSTTSAEKVSTEQAYQAVQAAWTTFQAGVKAGLPVTTTALETAIAALAAATSPAMVTANTARAVQ